MWKLSAVGQSLAISNRGREEDKCPHVSVCVWQTPGAKCKHTHICSELRIQRATRLVSAPASKGTRQCAFITGTDLREKQARRAKSILKVRHLLNHFSPCTHLQRFFYRRGVSCLLSYYRHPISSEGSMFIFSHALFLESLKSLFYFSFTSNFVHFCRIY